MHKRLDNILMRLADNKALDIVSIDLEGKSDIADFLVIATGTSNRHVSSLSENLITELKKDGVRGRVMKKDSVHEGQCSGAPPFVVPPMQFVIGR